MSYLLMHKNIETAVLDINRGGRILNAAAIDSGRNHLPVGVSDRRTLDEWWKSRSIPDTREYIRRTDNKGNERNSLKILKDNLALSLSDCYWIREETDPITWEDVKQYLKR